VAVHKVYDVYVMNADGTDVRRLTTAAAGSRGSDSPTFSADGRRIVFATDFPDGARLFVINRDGTGLRALTHDGHLSPTFPTWSPDGRSIAFTSSQDGRTSIYVMEADGSRVRRLTGNGLDAHTVDDRPSWSPDSKRLVFDRYGADGIGHLVVMNADGTEQREVPTGPGVASEPSWTPDGHHLVFAWDADGRLVVDAGTDITQSHGGTKPSIIRVVGVDGGGFHDLVAVPGGVDDAATPEVAPRR
jgi:Tol biopolymer transport system component